MNSLSEIIQPITVKTDEFLKNGIHSQSNYLIELYWIDRVNGILGVRDATKGYVDYKRKKKNRIKCILTAESGAGIYIEEYRRKEFLGLAQEFLTEATQIFGIVWKIKRQIRELGFEWSGKLKCFAKVEVRKLSEINFNGKFYGRVGNYSIYVNSIKTKVTDSEMNEYLKKQNSFIVI